MTAPVEIWHECEDCEGRGTYLTEYRVSGSPYGGFIEHPCMECEGVGGHFEEAVQFTEVEDLGPGRIAA